jgi:hypothetical protein
MAHRHACSFRQYNADYHDGVNFPITQLASFLHISMPRVPCFCEFAQCGGSVVDSKTFNRHKRHDSYKRVQNAIATATTVCKSQDDAITAHLASLSLSHDPSINSTMHFHQPTAANTSSRSSGKSTEQKLVEELLYQLRDIEMLLEDLIITVDGELNSMGNPGAANDTFPLLSSISTARTIQAQLSGINSRAAPVQEAKSSLLVRLGKVVTRLEDAKGSWNAQVEDLSAQGDFPSETIFSTGKSMAWN